MIDISKSIGIRGWMSENELAWLAEQATTHKSIVEIGCFAGRSTYSLAKHTSGEVYVIDDFLGADDERPLSSEKSEALRAEFEKNLEEFIDEDKLIILDPEDFDEVAPDMVFIDGDHSYEGVSKDIKFWGPRLKLGGILCGHDSGHPPIRQALADLIPDVRYVPSTAIWYTVKQ